MKISCLAQTATADLNAALVALSSGALADEPSTRWRIEAACRLIGCSSQWFDGQADIGNRHRALQQHR